MSSLTTPTRATRGLMVPGIDTKLSADRTSASLSYGGLHTPPQSAHESRRPSLQYSTLSEGPFSASSNSFSYSQPSTPIHGINQVPEGFVQGWHASTGSQMEAMTIMPNGCGSTQISEHSLPVTYAVQPSCNPGAVETTSPYSHLTHRGQDGGIGLQVEPSLPSMETWKPLQEIANGYMDHNTCLGAALFAPAEGLNDIPDVSMPSFSGVGSASHQVHPHLESSSVGNFQAYGVQTALQNHPQVVVPSQLSPQDDYLQHHFSHYMSPDRSQDGYSTSFGSSSTGFHDYETLRAPSPADAYFAHSEDEDYVAIKAEEMSSPFASTSSRRLAVQHGLPTGSKRRSPRRLRKAGKNIACHVHDIRGCLVQCEGKQCYLNPVKYEKGSNKKPHECKYPNCYARFDRSEHLKRHLGKHQDKEERKYPCPLCTKRIGRPDNAGDHFKTHLRPKTKGKRNDHFDWPVLRDAILNSYEDHKSAKKLIDNLHRWMSSGMPDNSSSRREV